MSLFSISRRSPAFPSWLDAFDHENGVALISPDRPYKFAEDEYDAFYQNDPADEESGRGLVTLVRQNDGDFGGPILELGCGSGKMTLGMCRTRAFPNFLITDGSCAFLDLTKEKLLASKVGIETVRFATLRDCDMNRIPQSSLSAVVMRSTLHHFSNVPEFIRATAASLRPGGSFLFQEPCANGYLLMGLLARLIGGEIGATLTDEQRQKAHRLAETMSAYHRTDIDKTEWEDKHVFRPEQVQEWAQHAGLTTRYYPNHTFEDFGSYPPRSGVAGFHKFMLEYMNYCMGFGGPDSQAIMAALVPYTDYLKDACAGTREPAMMGVFLLQKPTARTGRRT